MRSSRELPPSAFGTFPRKQGKGKANVAIWKSFLCLRGKVPKADGGALLFGMSKISSQNEALDSSGQRFVHRERSTDQIPLCILTSQLGK